MAPEKKMADILTDIIINEQLRDDLGRPLTLSEVIDPNTGRVHPELLDKLRTAVDVILSVDQVRVNRYVLASELEKLAADARGGKR